jgi:hypothetical protein
MPTDESVARTASAAVSDRRVGFLPEAQAFTTMTTKSFQDVALLIVAFIAVAVWYLGSRRTDNRIEALRRERVELQSAARAAGDQAAALTRLAAATQLVHDVSVSGIGPSGTEERIWLSRSDSATILSTFDDSCEACATASPALAALARAAPCGVRFVELLVVEDRRMDSLRSASSNRRIGSFSLSHDEILRFDVLPSILIVGPYGKSPVLYSGEISPAMRQEITDKLEGFCK